MWHCWHPGSRARARWTPAAWCRWLPAPSTTVAQNVSLGIIAGSTGDLWERERRPGCCQPRVWGWVAGMPPAPPQGPGAQEVIAWPVPYPGQPWARLRSPGSSPGWKEGVRRRKYTELGGGTPGQVPPPSGSQAMASARPPRNWPAPVPGSVLTPSLSLVSSLSLGSLQTGAGYSRAVAHTQ